MGHYAGPLSGMCVTPSTRPFQRRLLFYSYPEMSGFFRCEASHFRGCVPPFLVVRRPHSTAHARFVSCRHRKTPATQSLQEPSHGRWYVPPLLLRCLHSHCACASLLHSPLLQLCKSRCSCCPALSLLRGTACAGSAPVLCNEF